MTRAHLTLVMFAAGCGQLWFEPLSADGDDGGPLDALSDIASDRSSTDATGIDATQVDGGGLRDGDAVDTGTGDGGGDAGGGRDGGMDVGPVDASPPDASTDMGACCTAWCQDENRFAGPTSDLEAFVASAPGCSSSTGCTCTTSALIATTWTIVTGNICDTHDFATSCPGGCDGSQCGTISISGRFDEGSGVCTCVGTIDAASQDIWDSSCVENVEFDSPFSLSCP